MTLAEGITRACNAVLLLRANRIHDARRIVEADPVGIVGALETISQMHGWSEPSIACAECGRPFSSARHNKIYCSPTCRRNYHTAVRAGRKPLLVNGEHTIACLQCGAEFRSASLRVHFCSAHCKSAAWASVYNAKRAACADLLANGTIRPRKPDVEFRSADEEARSYISACKHNNSTVSSEVCRDIALDWGLGRGEAARLVRDLIEEIGLGRIV